MVQSDRRGGSSTHYLYDYIKKKVDLAEFLETEIGCTLKWYEPNISAGVICPMPHHKDTKPSLRIKFDEESETWIFHCLGCGAKGTIIDFFVEYYGLNNSTEAVWQICKKFGFKNDAELVASSLRDVKKKINLQKKMECVHIVTANQCRRLLRRDYDKHKRWVSQAYQIMNKALDEQDISVIEKVGYEASSRM